MAPTTLARIRKLGLALDGAEEGSTHGAPALKVGGKLFACLPVKKEVEPDTLMVRMSFVDRDLRIQADPSAYYLTPHYVDYPCVLARPARLTDARLRELLEAGWEFVRDAKGRKARKPSARK